MGIRDLTNKVANNGANVNGKLTAEEYNVLITQVKNMSNGAVYMGVATPTTTPQTFDGNVELVYLATTAGKYTAFGNIVVNNDEICALRWRYSVGWGKEVIATNDYTTEEKAKVAKIEGKQDALTLTVKDNGNIVLGNLVIDGKVGQTKEFMPATPSGDPMHYYYLSHFGVTYNESTGFFELEYLKDLTANDMRNAVRVSGDTRWLYNDASSLSALVAPEDRPRTNIAMRSGISQVRDKYNGPRWERALEQWIIGKCSAYNFATLTDIYDGNAGVKFTLVGLAELRYIVGVIDISTLASRRLSEVLGELTLKLQEVRLAGLKTSQTIIAQKNLSKDSISYLLSNRINTEEISLSLPAELYNKIMNVGGEWADLRTLCEATTDKGAVILEQNA